MTTLKTTITARANEYPAEQDITQLLAQNWWAFAIRGVLGIIFGLIAIFQPGVTMLSLVLVFSAYAFVDGTFAIVASVRGGTNSGDFWYSRASSTSLRLHSHSCGRPSRSSASSSSWAPGRYSPAG